VTLHFGEEQFPVELTIDMTSGGAGFIDFAPGYDNPNSAGAEL
jgi:hypothetical protein